MTALLLEAFFVKAVRFVGTEEKSTYNMAEGAGA
jgi:hypothetical protein